jgi:hypothetical protein
MNIAKSLNWRGSLGMYALVAVAAVAISALFLPGVTGYGTRWFQVVTLYGWHFAQKLTSSDFVYGHRYFGWVAAGIVSTALFAIPTFIVWLICRSRWSSGGRWLIAIWCAFYLACLFALFPATEGP